ncbi:hypothetical protein D1007_50339 [Hordeum vulgare]|nr:hypothetical protein D1007_50339 [Hordeum vulgare]
MEEPLGGDVSLSTTTLPSSSRSSSPLQPAAAGLPLRSGGDLAGSSMPDPRPSLMASLEGEPARGLASAGASSRRDTPFRPETDLTGVPRPRLRSIIVAPLVREHASGMACADAPSRRELCGAPVSQDQVAGKDWTLVSSRRGRLLARRQEDLHPQLPRVSERLALSPAEAFKRRFGNRCFRCLGSRHKSSHYRDHPICYTCKRTGHFERACPNRHQKDSVQQRVLLPHPTAPPAAAGGSAPPLLPAVAGLGSAPAPKMVAGLILGAAHRRPATSTCSVVSTPEMEDESYHLRTTALLLTAVGPCSGITADMVAEAVEHDQDALVGISTLLLASQKTSCWCCRKATSVTSSSSGASWWWPELSSC